MFERKRRKISHNLEKHTQGKQKMQRFDMGNAWVQTVAMLKGNREILVVIAGFFFFVPSLLWSLMAGEPPQPEQGADITKIAQQLSDYLRPAAPWIFLASLASIVGSLAIWRLMLARGGTSVGGALSVALVLFFSYFVASLLVGVITFIGFLALIVPGFYLSSRFSLTGPHMAATEAKNPIEAMSASWSMTKGSGWWILLYIIIVALVGWIVITITGTVFGGLFALTLPEGLANTLSKIVEALFNAALSTVMIVSYAAIYRQLDPAKQVDTFE